MTDDLVAFINARLDEDEQAARASHYEGQRWLAEEEGVSRWPDDEPVHMADRKADARHIARHDPARVLRGVEAKRQLLDLIDQSLPGNCDCEAYGHHTDAETALRLLATERSDHPDYRQEWTP